MKNKIYLITNIIINKKIKNIKLLIKNKIMLNLKSRKQKSKTENKYLLLYPVYFFFVFFFVEEIIFDLLLNPNFFFFHYIVTFYNNINSILPFNLPEIYEINKIPEIPEIPNISDIPDKYKEILKNYKNIKIINEGDNISEKLKEINSQLNFNDNILILTTIYFCYFMIFIFPKIL